MIESEFLFVVGQNIAYYRKLQHLTQTDLAKLVDMKQVSVATIEGGKVGTTIKTLKRIADVLHIDPQQLLKIPARQNKNSPTKR